MALSTGETKAAAAQNERRMLVRAVESRYRVAELLSKGGMGSIYRGWEPGLERHVAIKLLAPGRALDPDERGRFRREGRILASLAHRNVVPVLATGELGDASWFSMPCMSGTLARLLVGGARLPAEEVRAMLVALADALAYVHQRGIIHRDIKAENILLDEEGRPVISDFGVAILRTSEHSRAEAVRGYGTPEYMAPEQFLGTTDCDGRQDIYSLGVLGFRMLTGRFPLEGSQQQIAAAHVTREIPTVRAYAADVPEDLAAAVDRCLMRHPLDRWHDAGALREALRTRSARPSGRLVRLVRRMFHRMPTVAALL